MLLLKDNKVTTEHQNGLKLKLAKTEKEKITKIKPEIGIKH